MTEKTTHGEKKATMVQLIFLIYGASCGGAFGVEPMISESGPGVAMMTMALVPLLFCLPIAFAVGELTAAFPLEGGNYRWSRIAFGDFWGFQAGWWAWLTGVVTNVIFAIYFANYLKSLLPWLGPWQHWGVCIALIWTMHYVNLRGIEVVGNAAILFTVLLLIPFAGMAILGFLNYAVNPISPFVATGKSFWPAFGAAMAPAIFLYSGYDKLSAVAEEVENPQKAFPPALFFAVGLSVGTYLIPTLGALAAKGDWAAWGEGYFPTAAANLGGAWLGNGMAIAGLLGNALLLNVTMLAVSRIPLTLAEDGFLPPFLTRMHPKYGTPSQSLLWGSVTYSLLTLLDYNRLLIINSWLQMLNCILIYANVWMLRATHPDTERPFLVPAGRFGLTAATIGVWLLAMFAIYGSLYTKEGALDYPNLVVGLLALLSGTLLYGIVDFLRKYEWKFVDPRSEVRPSGDL